MVSPLLFAGALCYGPRLLDGSGRPALAPTAAATPVGAPTAATVGSPIGAATTVGSTLPPPPPLGPVPTRTAAPSPLAASTFVPPAPSPPSSSPTLVAAATALRTSVSAPTPSPARTRTADEEWRAIQPQLDAAWGKDWGRVLELLAPFYERFPGHPEAKEKLYAARIAHGLALMRDGTAEDVTRGATYFELAASLFPGRKAPPAGTVLWQDNFDDPAKGKLARSSGREAQVVTGYADREYHVRRVDPTYAPLAVSFLPGSYVDVSVAADMRLVGPVDNRYGGIACRDVSTSEGSSQYRFVVAPGRGTFQINRWEKGRATSLAAQASSAIRQGNQANRLELSCVGSTITARVNGTNLASVQDGTHRAGTMMLLAGSFTDVGIFPVDARFDGLAVTQG